MDDDIGLVASIARLTFGIIAIFSNGALISIILARTPKKMKAFSIILLDFAVSDLVNASMEVLVLNLQYQTPVYLVNQAEGLCTYVLPQLCFAFYGIQLHSFFNSVLAQPFSFYYRYRVLTSGDLKSGKVFLGCILIYFPSFAYCALFISLRPDIHSEIKSYVNATSPAMLSQTATYFGASMASPQTLFLIFYVIAPWAPVLFLNFYYRSKALKFLRDNTTHFSVELRRLQQHQVQYWKRWQALTINALLPLTFCAGFITIFLIYLGVYTHPLFTHLYYVSVLISPAFAPLFQLYYILPYRRAIRDAMPSKWRTTPLNTVTISDGKASDIRA
ncbi:hypothetical protein PRIPAC_83756 [Pristionchus pacificus]|uniref:G protein-coupled receptor n=1 Tax=Pristionchus pacificus TaxID=54126 RepID=A0A2A6BUT9_PRIPA|nr:hypothetical protein PRIPAC_83756 [Pristionchus pacificus]|eukprot:PDM69665.1 G protein-coupled receptor [Pristionchus pacificus]